jgi:hypothetical protein
MELGDKLVIGTKIKIGSEYCGASYGYKAGQIVELVLGHFEYDNGLYSVEQTAPAVWNEEDEEYDSIYHLFGAELDGFADCQIVEE